jgi:hypothetical protein
MPSHAFKVMVLCAPLLLAACGEGYEMVRVEGVVPYTEPRTAGTGVAYVRAKMLPEKELKVETTVETTTVTPPVEPAGPKEPEIKSAEPVFQKKQQK